jgi:hypothetical protein
MTMAASVVLENLPKDATRALETAGELGIAKGIKHLLIQFRIVTPTNRLTLSLYDLNSDNPPLAPPQHALPPPTAVQVFFESAV